MRSSTAFTNRSQRDRWNSKASQRVVDSGKVTRGLSVTWRPVGTLAIAAFTLARLTEVRKGVVVRSATTEGVRLQRGRATA
jgi:hypothetical protein